MKLVPESYSTAELIEEIDTGRIALPEFQRDFIWKPPAVADLLRTVARRWPAGTFLLLRVEGEPEFAYKAFKGAPKAQAPRVLVLDGQQRTTALYQALTERAEETYFVDMGAILAANEFDDESLKYLKNSRFAKQYSTLKDMALGRVAKVATLADELEWTKWLRYLDEDEQDRMIELRASHLSGLSSYDIPAVALNADVPLAAIAKIFETLNRTGTRLATFDLMVARLYPYDFRLRDRWEEARSDNPELAAYGVDDGVEPLKVIAMREHLRQRDANVRLTVKGVRESDVLNLAPDTVIGHWDGAVNSYVRALQFLRDSCGAIRQGLIPSKTIVLPLAHLLGPSQTRRASFDADLRRWFWATAFTQTYAQGANTQAVTDARALRAWNEDANAVPDVIRHFKLDVENLIDGRRRNEMLLRGLMCWTVVQDGRDWIENRRFRDISDSVDLEFHHIIPDEFLSKHYDGEKNPVANFSLLTKPSNGSLRNTHPRDALQRPDVKDSAVRSNLIDTSALANAHDDPKTFVDAFLRSRVHELQAAVAEAVGP